MHVRRLQLWSSAEKGIFFFPLPPATASAAFPTSLLFFLIIDIQMNFLLLRLGKMRSFRKKTLASDLCSGWKMRKTYSLFSSSSSFAAIFLLFSSKLGEVDTCLNGFLLAAFSSSRKKRGTEMDGEVFPAPQKLQLSPFPHQGRKGEALKKERKNKKLLQKRAFLHMVLLFLLPSLNEDLTFF